MKKILPVLCAILFSLSAAAQNDKADNIIGTYLAGSGDDAYKVQITKLPDGTYKGAVCWTANPYDKDGKLSLDTKNPNKALRSTPLNKIELFSGLAYDSGKQNWSGTKIYDPNRGIQVKMTAKFESPGKLVVRGTVLGIGESITWIKE